MDFIETDSDDGDRKPSGEETTFTEEEIESIKESILALKAEGNAFFTAGDHDNALAKYSVFRLNIVTMHAVYASYTML